MRFVSRHFAAFAVAVLTVSAHAAQTPLPPKPADFVLDEAGIFSPEQRGALIAKLEKFERETSNQVVVAVIPQVPGDYVMEDFTQRTAEAWGVGRKEHDNGIVLFVFPESRKVRIEVGYGLEGAVPDALANSIIQDVIIPLFRQGDMPGGIEWGAQALMAASKGEYTGVERSGGLTSDEIAAIIFVIVIVMLILYGMAVRGGGATGGRSYGRSGAGDSWFSSGGGGSSGSSGGFSSGGGSFGGGGASGSW